MSAVVTIVIVAPNETITQLNARLFGLDGSGAALNPDKSQVINNSIDLLSGCAAGKETGGATIQITTRDTDPAVSTSGTGSKQKSVTVG